MATNTNQKDTVYIDIDDEITAIIDKVHASPQRIVALVLPKRATVLQSLVNMKLLKRAADADKKHLVLITSEAGLLPLAGSVGLYVAPSLQSRPVMPTADGSANALPAAEAVDESVDFDPDEEASTPVGELAGPAAFASADDIETIELDNDTEEPVAGADTVGATSVAAMAARPARAKKDNKLKIPDFNKFRLGLVLGGLLLIAIIVFAYLATSVLPKATVTLATDTSDIPTNATVTLDPSARTVDLADAVLPAKIVTKQQSGSQQVPATGQKNNGTKASGTVTVSEVCTKKPAPIDAGTGFSSGNLTFISTDNTSLSPAGFDSDGNVVCNGTADIVSQQAGAKYNLPAGSKFTIAGYSNATASNGQDITGGTDDIVKVVSQSDIDNAKSKITSGNSGSVKSDLQNQLQSDGYTAVVSSLKAGDPQVTANAQVGDQADTVTVTSSTTYTMYGVKTDDLKSLIMANVTNKIDTSKQKILKDGVDSASFTVASPASSGQLQAQLSATTTAGPEINPETLKTQIAGKKAYDVRTIATATPGVTNVTVKYSPFWVSHVPSKTSRITIIIQKTNGTSTNAGTQ